MENGLSPQGIKGWRQRYAKADVRDYWRRSVPSRQLQHAFCPHPADGRRPDFDVTPVLKRSDGTTKKDSVLDLICPELRIAHAGYRCNLKLHGKAFTPLVFESKDDPLPDSRQGNRSGVGLS